MFSGDEYPDVMEPNSIPHEIPQLDEDVIAGWEWWLESSCGHKRCPSTREGDCENADCNKFCRPIFPKIKNRTGKWVSLGGGCPCYTGGYAGNVEEIVKKVLAAQEPKKQEFEPYAAVINEHGACGWEPAGEVVTVIGKKGGALQYGPDGVLCSSEGGSDPIANPIEARDRLIELHGNPALDELERWLNKEMADVRHRASYRVACAHALDKLTELRAHQPKAPDEAAIRKDEREKVIKEVRNRTACMIEMHKDHNCENQPLVSWVRLNALFDTLEKGGDEFVKVPEHRTQAFLDTLEKGGDGK